MAAKEWDVVPAKAGTHIPEAMVYGTMGPRLRGDDTSDYVLALAQRSGRSAFFQPGTLARCWRITLR